MKLSLRKRLSIFTALAIAVVTVLSIALYISMYRANMHREMIARGNALSYAFSKSAEVGLIEENLSLIEYASYIVHAENVAVVQVFSPIWDSIDSYPVEKLHQLPDPAAEEHFKKATNQPFYIERDHAYDFYRPINIKSAGRDDVLLGYIRLVLTEDDARYEFQRTVAINVIIALIVAAIAIAALNRFIGRVVIEPVMFLHKAASEFKNGRMPNGAPNKKSTKEIKELTDEFYNMCRTIKEKEAGLIKSEARIKEFFNRVEHSIFRLDKDGRITDCNGRFRELFGDAHAFCEIVSDGRDASEGCLKEAMSGELIQRERSVVDKHGAERTVLLSLYKQTDESGTLIGFDGYMIDLTEKKKLEEGLLRSQKLEAVGTLAGGIAHDFNNLLAAILGFSEIMLDQLKEDDPLHKPAKIIHSAAERGAELTSRILSVTRRERFETKLINANRIVGDCVELLKSSIPKSIDIVANLAPDLPAIMADPSQIQQAIINLALNARDAMPDGGRLFIETHAVGMDEGAANAEVKPELKGAYVKLSISDTGVGMTKDVQVRIFDPFFTTKDAGKGTGLGLYIVYAIITRHSGYINVYSEPGKGTRFTLYLPVAPAEAASGRIEAPAPMQEMRGTGTILVIDDEPGVREMFMDMLTPLGYEVMLAESGSEGVEFYKENHERISLVILDMVMPKMDGSAVYKELSAVNARVRVLLCSGFSQNGFKAIDDLLNRGAAGFLQKPFSRRDLAASIKRAISI